MVACRRVTDAKRGGKNSLENYTRGATPQCHTKFIDYKEVT